MSKTFSNLRELEQLIRERAHNRYLIRQKKGKTGNEKTDWLKAEQSVLKEVCKPAT